MFFLRKMYKVELKWRERNAASDAKDRRAKEASDKGDQRCHLEADVLDQVVVERPSVFDCLDDRRKVIVGQDHHGGILGDFGAGNTHYHADICLLERWGGVDAIAVDGYDVALGL